MSFGTGVSGGDSAGTSSGSSRGSATARTLPAEREGARGAGPFPPSQAFAGYGPKKVITRCIRSAFCAAVPYASNGNARKTTLYVPP